MGKLDVIDPCQHFSHITNVMPSSFLFSLTAGDSNVLQKLQEWSDGPFFSNNHFLVHHFFMNVEGGNNWTNSVGEGSNSALKRGSTGVKANMRIDTTVKCANDNATFREKERAQLNEKMLLTLPTYTSTPASGIVSSYGEELGHMAYQQGANYVAWKIDALTVWCIRKSWAKSTSPVLRLCRVRVLKLVLVPSLNAGGSQSQHVTCSCKCWDMRRLGCRHVTWALSPLLSPGFFHIKWTLAHMTRYGRKGQEDYTALADKTLARNIPGPCAERWVNCCAGLPCLYRVLKCGINGKKNLNVCYNITCVSIITLNVWQRKLPVPQNVTSASWHNFVVVLTCSCLCVNIHAWGSKDGLIVCL